jgi:NodT family efflux transporter outer membrane factor (OMF) lipoprotein
MVPAYVRPVAPAPQQFSSIAMPSTQVAIGTDWWKSFNSDELDRLVSLSLAGDNDLQAAEARLREAQGAARIAGAQLSPSVSLGGDVSGSTRAPDGHGFRSGTSGSSLLAQASYDLDLWGRNRAIVDSAKSLVGASMFDRATVSIALVSTVANLYFEILSLRERHRFASQIAADARRVLDLVLAQHLVGTATELQIEQQRDVVATFNTQVPLLAQQMEQDTHALAVLLGRAPQDVSIAAVSLGDISLPPIGPGLPSALLERRPDVRAAEQRLVSANFDVGAARAALFPSISLTGAGGGASGALSQALLPIAVANGGVSLLQPLIDGGRRRGQLQYDKAHRDELAAIYRQTVLSSFRDVEDALSAILRLAEAGEAEECAVASSQRAASLSEAQYRLGVIDLLTLLDTQRSYYQAEDMVLQLRLQRLQAIVGLFRALGGAPDQQS